VTGGIQKTAQVRNGRGRLEKKGRKSYLVREDLGFYESDEQQHHTICTISLEVISAPLGNTTNLLNHL
jgi:hypothetical protein